MKEANTHADEHTHSDPTHRVGVESSSHNWMQGAVKHPGSFTKEAKAHKMSVHAYAEKEKHASGKVGDRARLALTFEKEAGK